MAERFESLSDKHQQFIAEQQIFFVGTAGAEGSVNVSPKGMDSLRVLDDATVAWLNLTGSGNESAAHVLENGRMTIMFCSFGKQPLIMRLYGRARVVHRRDEEWARLLDLFPEYPSARQVFVMDIQMVQTSCGYGVPRYEFSEQRPTLVKWSKNKSDQDMEAYWREKNLRSLDGADTGLFADPQS